MGYDLHITRAKDWSQNEGFEIGADEWLRVVEEDPELSLAGMNGPYFAVWIRKSIHQEPWFDWFAGNIYTKNPDEPMIEKMLSIAKRLNGKVQGDDGEVYPGAGREPYYE